jgi:Family of unknown function (DUF5723)
MRRTLVFFLFLPLSLLAQQELGLSFQSNELQSLAVNPAFFPKKTWTIGLPGFYADGRFSANLGLRQMFPKNSDGSTGFDVERVLSELDDSGNALRANFGFETFQICFKKNRLAFSLSHAQRTNAQVGFPKKLVELLYRGNAQFIGETIEIGPDFDVAAWQEIAFGVSSKKGPLTFGGRGKLLVGSAAGRTDQSQISVFTDPDIYQIKMQTDFGFFAAGDVLRLDTAGLGFNPTVNFPSPKNASFENIGFGIDLGARLDLGKIELGASILDLGSSIKWTKNANYHRSNGIFDYDGVNFPPSSIVSGSDLNFSGKLDSLNDALNFKTSAAKFETTLPTRILINGQYKLTENWQLGATFFAQKSTDSRPKSQAVAVQIQRYFLNKKLRAGVNYSLDNHSAANFGATIGVAVPYFRFFATSDHLLTAFQPYKSNRVNFRIGASVEF